MTKDEIKKFTAKIINNFTRLEEGDLPDTKVIKALHQFAENDYENFQVSSDIPEEMKKDLLKFHNSLKLDGGKNLSLDQLTKASHLYNKKANYIRFKMACLLSYKNWCKRFFESQVLIRVLEGKFGSKITTQKAKHATIMKGIISPKTEEDKLLHSLQNTIDICESLILIYEDDSKRTDRELTTLNRLSESKIIEQKSYLNNNRR